MLRTADRQGRKVWAPTFTPPLAQRPFAKGRATNYSLTNLGQSRRDVPGTWCESAAGGPGMVWESEAGGLVPYGWESAVGVPVQDAH